MKAQCGQRWSEVDLHKLKSIIGGGHTDRRSLPAIPTVNVELARESHCLEPAILLFVLSIQPHLLTRNHMYGRSESKPIAALGK